MTSGLKFLLMRIVLIKILNNMTDWKKIKKNLKSVGEILVDSAEEIRKGVKEEIKEKQFDEKFKKAKDTLAEKLENIGKEVNSFLANVKEGKPAESMEEEDNKKQRLFKAMKEITASGNILKREKAYAEKEVNELSEKLNAARQNYNFYSEELDKNRKLAEKLDELVLSQDYSELDSILSELGKN